MTKFGVNMEELQKLCQFKLQLMEKSFKAVVNEDTVEKMEFIGMVQLKSEIDPTPQIKRVCVGSQTIHIDDSLMVISKGRIFKITPNNNEVIVKFRMPLYGLGSTLTLTFLRSDIKNSFLEALGDVNNENYESDTSSQGALSPPHSDTSSEALGNVNDESDISSQGTLSAPHSDTSSEALGDVNELSK